MTNALSHIRVALAAALDLPDAGKVPEWVHLLPAIGTDIRTFDGRGPYRVADAAAVIAASFQDPRDAKGLILDENHAADKAATLGLGSPSRGKIVAMEARADGIWGRVKWNKAGADLVADEAYRGISPVFVHDERGVITRILRASLVNNPNLRGLAPLHQENPMTLQARLAEKLGLKADATDEDILAACAPKTDTALQSAITEIGTALGVEGGDAKAVVAAAKLVKATGTDVVALQAQVTSLTTQLETVTQTQRRAASTAFIDGALKAHRAGVNQGNRDELIALHMEQPAVVEKLIGGMPQLGPTGMPVTPPPADGSVALNAEQLSAAKALGISVEAYTKSLKADQETR